MAIDLVYHVPTCSSAVCLSERALAALGHRCVHTSPESALADLSGAVRGRRPVLLHVPLTRMVSPGVYGGSSARLVVKFPCLGGH